MWISNLLTALQYMFSRSLTPRDEGLVLGAIGDGGVHVCHLYELLVRGAQQRQACMTEQSIDGD